MKFKFGNTTRPNNEVVVSVSYYPQYNLTREIAAVTETWSVRGRIVLQGADATSANMGNEIRAVNAMAEQQDVDVVILDDDGTETPWKIRSSECNIGPRVTYFGWTASENDVYTNGQGYTLNLTAERPYKGGLLSFTETLQPIEPGGQEYVYVGGSVNYPERQLGSQHLPWRAVQSGTAVGLLGYPVPPAPIFPFAMSKPNQAFVFTLLSPKKPGKIDSEFTISWSYDYAWHQPLIGIPNRLIV
jgi:hypothetical protein